MPESRRCAPMRFGPGDRRVPVRDDMPWVGVILGVEFKGGREGEWGSNTMSWGHRIRPDHTVNPLGLSLDPGRVVQRCDFMRVNRANR